MTPIELLRLVADPLKREECLFAVCGGVASGVYRTTFRTTNDLDIALFYPPHIVGKSEKEFAINFLHGLGVQAKIGFIPGIAVQDESNVFLVVGEFGGFLPSLDFILPNLP